MRKREQVNMPTLTTKGGIRIPLKVYYESHLVTIADTNYTNRAISIRTTEKSFRYGTGDFAIRLMNMEGQFTNAFAGGELVKVYADHATTIDSSGNQIYEGKILQVKHGLTIEEGFITTLYGKTAPELDFEVSASFTDALPHTSIQALLNTHAPGIFTYTGMLQDTSVTFTAEYDSIPLRDIIADILKRCGQDGYVAFGYNIVTFKDDGSNKNNKERVAFGDNMIPFDDFGYDFEREKNFITVIGKNQKGVQMFSTKQSAASQARLWKKSMTIIASSLTTRQAIQERASVELSLNVAEQVGDLSAFGGLPTLRPAQFIYCTEQYAGVNDFYRAIEYTHNIDMSGWVTSIGLSREIKDVKSMFKNQGEVLVTSNSDNPNNMLDSPIYLVFDSQTDISSLGDLEIIGGRLRIKDGFSQGTMTTSIITLDNDATQFDVVGTANDHCRTSYIEVSNDGGSTYSSRINLITGLNTVVNFSTTGKSIVAKITLVSDAANTDPEIESMSVRTK